jgi:competence protein ComEA
MEWKKTVEDYLSFTRRDRIAIISLILIISAVFFLPRYLAVGKSRETGVDSVLARNMDHLEQSQKNSVDQDYRNNSPNHSYHNSYPSHTRTKIVMFFFDPNSISADQWQKLGLRDKTIHTIQNYLSKGGKFKKPEDLKKIWGLFPDEYEKLEPFIKIDNLHSADGNRQWAIGNTQSPSENKQKEVKYNSTRYEISSFDINSADTSQFIALPGIGSKLANRIVNFRDKLGGFYSVEQVGETFGLADSTFQKIKKYLNLSNSQVRRININTATLEEFKAHPYIRYAMASAIVSYRKEHGDFKKIEDLKNVMMISEESYRKITPYLFIE